MGWILGLAGKYSETDLQKLKSLYPAPLYSFKNEKLFITAGGIEETCLASVSKDQTSGWIVCGIGIEYHLDNASFMGIKEWGQEFKKKEFSPYHLNGHFAAARWNENKIELFTDQLGVRKIYVTKLNECVAFSTRPDWITKLNSEITIDWEIFGSRWLLFNQATNKNFLKNVKTLNQAGELSIEFLSPDIKVKNKSWHPDLVPELSGGKNFISVLKDFTLCEYKSKYKSLALSGGLDSRILFAFLLSSENKKWYVHSLNFPNHPDTKIAEEISGEAGIEHISFKPFIPPAENIISLLSAYTGETLLAPPVSKFCLMQFYSVLHNQNKIVIDGTYGELARRRFLNNILIKGRGAVFNRDYEKIISLLRANRPQIFREDYVRQMKKGVRYLVEEAFNTLPPAKEYGIKNWLELFMIRNHLVTTTAEQARSDKMLINYMPFIQPSLLKIIFQTPSEKRNNNLFYKIIKQLSPELSKIPLVKGDVIYPFGLGTLSTSVYIRLKGRTKTGYKDNLQYDFLNSLEEYMQDTINSGDFLSCDYYNHQEIKNIVNGYYTNKNLSLANDMDWWLTFDIWRKNLYNN